MVSMVDGAEYKMGTITEPSTAVCVCVSDTPKEIPTKILAQGVDVDDIRVFSAIYIVQDANDVDVESVSRGDSYVTILLTNGETIRIGDDMRHACSIPPTLIPTPHPPSFTNSFASVLKILSDVELKDIEDRVFLLEERLQVVENNTGSADISALKLQVQTNTQELKTLNEKVIPVLRGRLGQAEKQLLTLTETTIPTLSQQVLKLSGDVTTIDKRVTNVEKRVAVKVVTVPTT